jgi:hypothetical protein
MGTTPMGKDVVRLAIGLLAIGVVLTVTAAPAAAVATTFSQQAAQTIYNPCTGEPVLVTGTVHIEQRESVSTTGAIHYQTTVHSTGFRGTTLDPINPVRYTASDVVTTETNQVGATETTFNQTQVYNRLGNDGRLILGDDFRAHLAVHATVNAKGDISSLRVVDVEPDPKCQ